MDDRTINYLLSVYENIEIPIAISGVLTCANHTHKAHGVGDGLSLSLSFILT